MAKCNHQFIKTRDIGDPRLGYGYIAVCVLCGQVRKAGELGTDNVQILYDGK